MSKKKIVVTQPMGLSHDQTERLKFLGETEFYGDRPKTPEEWLEHSKEADIICTGMFGLRQKYLELSDVFISLPFVGVWWLDAERAKAKNIAVANSPGCNRHAVSEWIVGMMINLLRELPRYINIREVDPYTVTKSIHGLKGKVVCVLGPGNIGTRVAEVSKALEMNVKCFRRGDDLIDTIKDADVIIDTLSSDPGNHGILDRTFFQSLKKGSYFITVTSSKIHDIDAMIDALDGDILSGVATDAGQIQVWNTSDPFYEKLTKHPKILVTPHISYNTDVSHKTCNDMMIDNIEAWLKGKPINLVT